MARKLINKENEKLTCQYLEYGEKTEKNVENETQTLYDLEYCEKPRKTCEMKNPTVGFEYGKKH